MQRGRAARDLGCGRHVQGFGLLPDRLTRWRLNVLRGRERWFVQLVRQLKRVIACATPHAVTSEAACPA